MRQPRDRPAGQRGGYAGAMPVERAAAQPSFLTAGVVGGLAAGVAFVLAAMVAAVLQGASVLLPFRLFASVFLGEAALTPQVSPVTAVLVGLVAHFAIATAWGFVFGVLTGVVRVIRSSGGLALVGALFGTLVWLIDFYVMAPAFWPWFAAANPVAQFIVHVLFYGVPLGLWVARAVRFRDHLFR